MNIEWIIYSLLFIGLAIESIFDFRKREIWIPATLMEIPLLIGLNYAIGRGSAWLWVASLGIGAFFYSISIIAKEQLGKGDAFLFAMTGAGIGLAGNFLLLYLTFALTFAVAAYLWLFRKVGKGYRLPLAPFVMAAYCLIIAQRFLE